MVVGRHRRYHLFVVDSTKSDGDVPTMVCTTVIKNEAWFLRSFLEAASEWADVIVVGDNGSTDDSIAIANEFQKAVVVDVGKEFDEGRRRKALLDATRKLIPARRVIFSLDADEMLSANWRLSPEWGILLSSPVGARFSLDWVCALPNLHDSVVQRGMLFGFVDDNTPYAAGLIHSPRVPPKPESQIDLKDIQIIHLTYLDVERLLAKHRFYQCIEVAQNNTHPIDACIFYQGSNFSTFGETIVPISSRWLDGLPLPKVNTETDEIFWYDDRVLELFREYGVARFRRVDIWYKDWADVARRRGYAPVADPRNRFERAIHRLITKNKDWLHYPITFPRRAAAKSAKIALRRLGW